MSGNPDNLLIPNQNTPEVWLAPTTTALPAGYLTDLAAAGYTNVGYIDSVAEISRSADETTYTPWNSADPVHTCMTNQQDTIALRFAETTRETIGMAFGDGTWSVGFGGAQFVPSGAAYPPKRLVYRIAQDDGTVFLLVFPVVQVTSVDEILGQDDKCSTTFTGITFKRMAPLAGEPPFKIMTNVAQLVTP